MPGQNQIKEMILGATEGATGSLAALEAIGCPGSIEDFDVEVSLDGAGEAASVAAVVRFSIVVGQSAAVRRSVA